MPSRLTPALLAGVLASSLLAAGPLLQLDRAALADGHELDESMLNGLNWRSIGPGRGGRVQAVAGIPGDATTYYMGATGGGVWKTTDAGNTWRNVSDGYFQTGSVGGIAVAPSDPNVVYVGMGEADIRGNFSHGDGVYKSVDAGKTWTHIGLEDTRQIGRVIVDPRDHNRVFVAALGHAAGPNAQRGVFRSEDGGESWERVLFVSNKCGAVDVRMDPNNSRIIYAGMWEVSRSPWGLISGGEGSGLYRSTDSGDTWTELTNGLPQGIKGKISVSPSLAQRDLVYALVEADDGGVFVSTNAGDSWRKINEDRSLRQRAWYYTHIYADTQEADTVYVLNVGFHRSTDGGRTFSTIRVPHGDNHDLWIAPEDNQRMVQSNDGGANVSFNAGQTWSTQTNQPTAQFYHVTTDNNFPYRVYGAQQDNSTASVTSRGSFFGWQRDLYAVGGGESGYIAVHPENPDIVFAGNYSGLLTRYDHSLRKSRTITVWPENPMGGGADVLKYRFQWTFPILISHHDPETVYTGGNHVFKSTNGGASWDVISPDLTTNDKTKQASSGGPITKDNTGVEYYCTVFTISESMLDPNVIWAGSDDGLVHVTSDGGQTWHNVTPPDMGDWPMISLIDASPHDVDTAYMAVNRYKMDDFTPYVYRTTDRGQTWDLITNGINDDDAFVRAVREDPEREGLLVAGTETGIWFSMNHGDNWQPLQLNLPIVPITDLVFKEDDIVVATQGRSFWILDDITALRQIDRTTSGEEFHLYDPADAWRQRWDQVRVRYHVSEHMASQNPRLTVEFIDDDGEVIRSYDRGASASAGMNTFTWNMRHENPTRVPGAVGWPGAPSGPTVPPGEYTVRITIDGDQVHEQDFAIMPDPRVETTQSEYEAQYALALQINDAVDRAHTAVNTVRNIRGQIDQTLTRCTGQDGADQVRESANAIKARLTAIEETILQTRSKSSQDPLNFPVKINDKIGALANTVSGDYGPTPQVYDVFDMLMAQLQVQLDALDAVLENDVAAFNDLVHTVKIPAIRLDDRDDAE